MPIFDPKLKGDIFDISGEIYRTYTFPGFDQITITGSSQILVGKDGFDRIWDGTKAHKIPPSWIHLEWETVSPIKIGF